MVEQAISGETPETQTTSGKYRIIEIYDSEYQRLITNELPKEKSLF